MQEKRRNIKWREGNRVRASHGGDESGGVARVDPKAPGGAHPRRAGAPERRREAREEFGARKAAGGGGEGARRVQQPRRPGRGPRLRLGQPEDVAQRRGLCGRGGRRVGGVCSLQRQGPPRRTPSKRPLAAPLKRSCPLAPPDPSSWSVALCTTTSSRPWVACGVARGWGWIRNPVLTQNPASREGKGEEGLRPRQRKIQGHGEEEHPRIRRGADQARAGERQGAAGGRRHGLGTPAGR